ncbi:MAG: pentapeptide repeat-containing protein [Cyanobacteriota bacterium]|nr:pentapeptide repeat-containing protein [Cyanobacteriota bacterium]
MANLKHLAILKQGVAAWNQYRKVGFSFREVNLQGVNFQEANLQGVNLKGANLQRANLQGVNLKGANLKEANLQRANLKEADLQRANLQEADLQGANLWAANLQRANLKEANLQDLNFRRFNIEEANLQGANLQRANLQGANLQRANLQGANLQKANLQGANLQKANLQEANLQEANLQGVNLQEANLQEANLQEANLQGANLGGTKINSATQLASKWHLVWQIQNFGAQNRDLRGADLRGADLRGIDFRKTDLRGADLRGADLRGIDFSGVNLREIKIDSATQLAPKWRLVWRILNQGRRHLNSKKADFREVDFQGADLRGVDFQHVNLSGANLRATNLSGANFYMANLSRADLRVADLGGANLNDAQLNRANLSRAHLKQTKALEADFTQAIFTGACIEDWNINSKTQLAGAVCDYIYLKSHKQKRRPHSSQFAPGDFAKLFQIVAETLDLVFTNGIEWSAFLAAFQQLQQEVQSDELTVQAIEKKSGGAFVIRVEVPADSNKAEIEKYLKREYNLRLKVMEQEYRAKLQAKNEHIIRYRQNSANMTEIVKLLANRPIHVETNAVANNHSDNLDFQGANIPGGVAAKNYGNMVETQHNYAPEQKQNLAEAAAEIQQLLNVLDRSYPADLPTDTQAEIEVAVKGISKDPALKKRVVAALKEGGMKALETFTDSPYVSILVAAYKGWHKG